LEERTVEGFGEKVGGEQTGFIFYFYYYLRNRKCW